MKSELVRPAHLARRAVVYIRQSTPAQVVSHQESLRLQYALVGRACELGWRPSDVDVIDADLGLSGASTTGRDGFKELAARVGLGEVGLVLSIDVTRLARNCSDWYPLLDICALRGCLIADRDGVYDPGSPNGRLLLGLKARSPRSSCTRSAAASQPGCWPRPRGASWRSPCRSAWCAGPARSWSRIPTSRCRRASGSCSRASSG